MVAGEQYSARVVATDAVSKTSRRIGAPENDSLKTAGDDATESSVPRPVDPDTAHIHYEPDPEPAAGPGANGRARSHADLTAELNALVAEHSEAIYRVARSVVRDSALAEDVVQETLIKVWRHLDSWRGEGSLKSWVLRIAHNTAVSTLRRIRDESRDPATLPESVERRELEGDVQSHALVAQLWEELQNFDELTRSIVVMRELEDMSYEEIAEALRVPMPTVKTRLFRARRALSVALEAWR